MSIANVENISKCQRGGFSSDTGRNHVQVGPEKVSPGINQCGLNNFGITYRHDAPSVEAGSARVETLEAVRSFDFSQIRCLENGSMGHK
jgi:hypothetical protein